MMELDITFEPSGWELALEEIPAGGSVPALQFLYLTRELDEEEMQQALDLLEQRRVFLDVESLPLAGPSGKDASRLRQEAELVKKNALPGALEETDPLRLYLEELAGIPAAGDLAVEAEKYLAGEEKAAAKLADLSLSRCVELAMEHCDRGVLLLDLIQEAGLGLWQGILCYEGGNFEDHRDWWIRQYLAKAVVLQNRVGELGQKLRQGMEDFWDVDQKLLTELGRNPTQEEIAQAMHVTREEADVFAAMINAAQSRRKIDEDREEKEPQPEDQQAVEDTAYFQSRQRVMELMSVLTAEEAKLLSLRFGLEGGLPMSPEETGRKLGMTPGEVVEAETAALMKLRNE